METQNVLGTGKVSKLLIKLSLPAILAQLINLLYNVVDRIYIARLPEIGDLAIAGMGVCLPILIIITAFSSLIGMGGAPRASIKLGEGKPEEAEKILGNSFVLLLLISAVLTTVFFIFKKPLLMAFGATENSINFANGYLSIYLIGTVFVQIALGLNSFISCQGFAKTSMATVLVGAVLNIALDPLFIFVFDMGVKGAALATIISQCVSALWVLRFLFGKKTTIRIKPVHFKLHKAVILPILALGISPFIMQSTEALVQLTFNAGMKSYGGANSDNYIAAMSIMFTVMQIISLPLIGLSQGAQPIISYNYGARQNDRVRQAFKLLLIISEGIAIALWLIVMLVPNILVKPFAPNSAILDITIRFIKIFMLGAVMLGFQFSCQQTFVALGQAKISLFLALFRKILLLIPLALILPLSFGVNGLLYAEPIADILAATVTSIIFFMKSKKLLAPNVIQEN